MRGRGITIVKVDAGPARILREWLREEIAAAGDEAIVTDVVIAQAEQRFLEDDDFRAAAAAFAVRDLLPEILRRLLCADRRIELGGEHVTRGDLEGRAATRYSSWRESVDERMWKPLTTLTRPELIAVAKSREKRAAGELRRALFLRDLSERLDNDTDTVGERFTSQELDTAWRRRRDQKLHAPTSPARSSRTHPALT